MGADGPTDAPTDEPVGTGEPSDEPVGPVSQLTSLLGLMSQPVSHSCWLRPAAALLGPRSRGASQHTTEVGNKKGAPRSSPQIVVVINQGRSMEHREMIFGPVMKNDSARISSIFKIYHRSFRAWPSASMSGLK